MAGEVARRRPMLQFRLSRRPAAAAAGGGRRKRMAVARLGGGGGSGGGRRRFFLGALRRLRLRWLAALYRRALRRLRACYAKAIADLIEGAAAVGAVRAEMGVDCSFGTAFAPVMAAGF